MRKCDLLYLAGQLSFQNEFTDMFRSNSPPSPVPNSMAWSITQAVGRRASPSNDYNYAAESGLVAGTMKLISLGLMRWDSPDIRHGLPCSKLRIQPSLLQLCQMDHCWNKHSKTDILHSLNGLL